MTDPEELARGRLTGGKNPPLGLPDAVKPKADGLFYSYRAFVRAAARAFRTGNKSIRTKQFATKRLPGAIVLLDGAYLAFRRNLIDRAR